MLKERVPRSVWCCKQDNPGRTPKRVSSRYIRRRAKQRLRRDPEQA